MQCDSYQRNPGYVRICSTHTHKSDATNGVGAAERPILLHRPPAGRHLVQSAVKVGQSPDFVETWEATWGRMMLPRLLRLFFFRGHLRRLAAPKARQERSSSTRVTRCSPPYDRSVDRDDSRKKIATLSFRREIAAITPFYLFWCSAAS